MNKFIKWTLITLVTLVVLVLVAAIAIPFLFKDKIEAAVKKEVNAAVNATVDWGDWDITMLKNFPDLTVEIADVKVCNNAPFEGICLADIAAVIVTVDIKSLFRDRIDIKRIGLTRPKLHFKVLEDGAANWDIALASVDTVPELPEDTASAFNIGLREYWITDGHIIYDDASFPMLMDLSGVDHTGSGDFTQDLFVLSTTSHVDSVNVVYDGVKYLRNAVADVKADLDMDLPNMKFTFKESEATVNRLVLGVDGWLAMPTDDIVMDLKWHTKRTDLGTLLSLIPAEFATDMNGVDMSGKVAFNGYVIGTYNETRMPGFGVTLGVDNGRFKYPDLPEEVKDIFVDLTIKSPEGADMDGMVVDLKRFAMKLADNPIDARLYLTHPISDPNIDADLRAALDLGSLQKVVPMEKGDDLKGSFTADARLKGVLSDIEAQRYDRFTAEGKLILLDMIYKSDSLPFDLGISSMYLDLSPRYLALTSYDGTIGASDLKANGRFDNYLEWWLKDSTMVGNFNVSSEKFDLNELMGTESAEAGNAADAPADTATMSVIEVPKNVDFTLNAQVNQVLYDNLDLRNCRGGLRVHDEQLSMRDLFFEIFGGNVKMNGNYSTQDKAHPRFALDYDVQDLDIEQTVTYMETVQKLAPIAKTCKGRFSTDMTMNGELDAAMMPLMNTLTGKGTLRTKSVRIDGFQPLVDIAKALKVEEIQNTTLQDVDFAYRFADGKMITDPFDVKIDRIKANVHGSTAFEDQAIDYDMKAKVPSDMFGAQANELVAGWLGQANQTIGSNFQVPAELDVNIKITGTIDKPIVKPVFGGGSSSVKETVIQEVKQTANEEIGKAKAEAIAKAREEAARLVSEAQKQADQIKAQARSESARIKGEGYAAADKLVNEAKDPLSKAAARIAADKLKKEADKKEQQFIAEADKRADGLVGAAKAKGDQLIQQAENTNTEIK